jgi:hypothetical protein
MKKTRKIKRANEVVVAITCDSCKREVTLMERGRPNLEGIYEYQEMLCWTNRGGYDSIFGDGTDITLDLCQHCVKKLLGAVLQFPKERRLSRRHRVELVPIIVPAWDEVDTSA